MENDAVTALDLARTQAKRVRREVTILVQMLARLEDNNPNLQPKEAQGNEQ
jgi:hypothetical protein